MAPLLLALLLGHIEGGIAEGQHAAWPGQVRVRRQGLEPRTRGLRADCSAASGVLPAQMPNADARKAYIAQGCGWRSSHESSHGTPGRARGISHSK